MADKTKAMIVLADPDTGIQSAFTRLFSTSYDPVCFSESEQALKFLKEHPGAAVIISCYNLPGRGGTAFLRAAEGIAPLAARIMLTHETSTEAILKAVNEGHAFMYLEKPCQTPDLVSAIETGLSHHRHMAKERLLLERTLSGSVRMLIEMLSLFHPDAFRRTGTVRKQAVELAHALGMKKTWELEMAVMLSPLGEALLPKHILTRYRAARTLNEQEREILDKAPAQTRELLKNIPQFDKVSDYLYLSARGFDGSGFPKDGPKGNDLPLVSRIIRLLTDLWYASPENGPDAAAFGALTFKSQKYDPRILKLARKILLDDALGDRKQVVSECHIRSLRAGDILVDDVLTETTRELVLAAGHVLTPTMVRRLEVFNQTSGIRQPVRVERHDVVEKAPGPAA